MTSSADGESRESGRSRSTSTTPSPTGGPASAGPPTAVGATRRSSTGSGTGPGSGATAWSSDRHHWRVLHEPETCSCAPELVEPFLAALDPPLFDDAIPALDALRGRIRLALLTNNPFGAEVLNRHGLHTDVFDYVVIADPLVRKPDPRALRDRSWTARSSQPARSHTSATASLPMSKVRSARDCARCGSTAGTIAWPLPPDVVRIASLLELHRPMLTVGFDLDMTLVDSRPGIRASMDALAQETGVPIDVDVVVARLGPKLEWELAQWFPADQVDQMCERYRWHYWDHCVGAGTLLLDGARDVDRRGARARWSRAGRHREVGAARVPMPRVGRPARSTRSWVTRTATRSATRSSEHAAGIYVGDTVTDIKSAIDASAIAVGVTTGPDDTRTLLAAGADLVLDSLDDFPPGSRPSPNASGAAYRPRPRGGRSRAIARDSRPVGVRRRASTRVGSRPGRADLRDHPRRGRSRRGTSRAAPALPTRPLRGSRTHRRAGAGASTSDNNDCFRLSSR